MNSRFSLTVLGILFSVYLTAQSFSFGTITSDVGVAGGIYSVGGYSPVNNSSHTGIGIIGTLPRVNAEFGVLNFLGVGVSYRRGTYGKKNDYKLRGNDLLLRVNFHLARKKNSFDLPIGVGYGTSTFGGNINATQGIHTSGSVLNVHVSPHFYFGKYVGMFLSLGYNKHFMKKVELIDNTKIYTEADGATWKMGGLYFEFGIAGKFDLLKKKKETSVAPQ